MRPSSSGSAYFLRSFRTNSKLVPDEAKLGNVATQILQNWPDLGLKTAFLGFERWGGTEEGS